MRFQVDFCPETNQFSLNDTEENVIIVIDKLQLEQLMKLYFQCFDWKGKNEPYFDF